MDPFEMIRSRVGVDPRELKGTTIAGEVPVPEDVANRLVAARLVDHPHIAGVRLEAHADDALTIQVLPRLKMLPPVTVAAVIEHQPAFPHDPMLALRWSMAGVGPFARLAGPMLGYLKKLPEGIVLEDDRLVVDVRPLLRARGMSDLLQYVKQLSLHTRQGVFILEFEIVVT